ncbi:cell envelope-like function transcriptional attenuator common domain protein [Clostridiales bacterium oral taxon 876 str. F0540]|nr:cell envelope-like function transcriptional attenuator common domain protein [Clostridiales bacterium oral taxon 876 str. F0540]
MENNKKRSDKHKNKKKNKKPVVISIVVILLLLVSSVFGAGYYYLSKINNSKISKSNEDLGINNDAQKRIDQEDPNKNIVNIALFGVDRREKNEASRSDSIMIATIDKNHKKIKLSSVMRDTYVNVPGHGMTKITHAYAYGGAQLAIKTLNENFQLNIKDYATVDFFSLEKIIDSMGGVTIDVKKEEVPLINQYMAETAGIEKKAIPTVTKPGTLNLNGMQAVAYSRIRYVGNGDYERTERQRKVLTALFEKIQAAGVAKYPSIVSTLLPYTETSISNLDLVSMGTGVLTSGTKTLDQERFPVDGYCDGKTIGGVYYLVADLKATTDQMHKYIFDDIKPTAKK